jgi:hypothetical protein
VEPTLPSLLFLTLNSCLRCRQNLVHGANLGMAACTLNDVVRDSGTLDDERTAAALRTLQQVLVFAPMHEGIGQEISENHPRPFIKICPVCSLAREPAFARDCSTAYRRAFLKTIGVFTPDGRIISRVNARWRWSLQ